MTQQLYLIHVINVGPIVVFVVYQFLTLMYYLQIIKQKWYTFKWSYLDITVNEYKNEILNQELCYGSPCQNGRSQKAADKECGGNRAIYTYIVYIKSVSDALNSKGKITVEHLAV